MGYNIGDVSGNSTGGPADWTFTIDTDAGATTVSGDFDVVPLFGGGTSEATDGYTAGALSTTEFGTLSFNTTTGQFTFTVDTTALWDSGSDQVVTFTITGTSGANSDDDLVTINLLICFAEGTRIATPDGERLVETLRPGDLVLTRDGAAKPLRWVGVRKVTAEELAADRDLRPIRIRQGALGGGLPERDLVVSPQHRMLMADAWAELMFGTSEILVPAKALINDHTIRPDDRAREVAYYHLLLDAHEVIFAEGAPTESFHPAEYTLGALEPQARADLEARVRLSAFGPTVRRTLRPWEAHCLLQQGRAA